MALPFALIALAIKLESRGQVFFRQERAGRGGSPFRPFKFRTMIQNATTMGLGYVVAQGDARITKVGRLLRNTFGIRVAFDWKGLVVAAAVMSFPLMVRAIRLGFQAIDPRLELAARTLGAGRMRTFFTISLPLAMHGVISGSVLAFARSLGEFGATVMLVSQRESTQTIPLLIYSMRDRVGGLDAIWPLVAVSIILAAFALGASEWLERRARRR